LLVGCSEPNGVGVQKATSQKKTKKTQKKKTPHPTLVKGKKEVGTVGKVGGDSFMQGRMGDWLRVREMQARDREENHGTREIARAINEES